MIDYRLKIEKYRLFNALNLEYQETLDKVSIEAHASQQGSAGVGLFDIRQLNQEGQGFIQFTSQNNTHAELPNIILCTNPISQPGVQHADYQLLIALFYYGFTIKIWQNKPYAQLDEIRDLDRLKHPHNHSVQYYTEDEVKTALQVQYITKKSIIIDSDHWHEIKKKFLEIGNDEGYCVPDQGVQITSTKSELQIDNSFYTDEKGLQDVNNLAFTRARKLTVRVNENINLQFNPERFLALESLHIIGHTDLTCVNISIVKMQKLKEFYCCNIKGQLLEIKNNKNLEKIQFEEESYLQNHFLEIKLEKLPSLELAHTIVANVNVRNEILTCDKLRNLSMTYSVHNAELLKIISPRLNSIYLHVMDSVSEMKKKREQMLQLDRKKLDNAGKSQQETSAYTVYRLEQTVIYDQVLGKKICDMTVCFNIKALPMALSRLKNYKFRKLKMIIDVDNDFTVDERTEIIIKDIKVESLDIDMYPPKDISNLCIKLEIPELKIFHYNMERYSQKLIKEIRQPFSPMFKLNDCSALTEVAINSCKILVELPSSIEYLKLENGAKGLIVSNIEKCSRLVYLDIASLANGQNADTQEFIGCILRQNIKYLFISDHFFVLDDEIKNNLKKNLIALTILTPQLLTDLEIKNFDKLINLSINIWDKTNKATDEIVIGGNPILKNIDLYAHCNKTISLDSAQEITCSNTFMNSEWLKSAKIMRTYLSDTGSCFEYTDMLALESLSIIDNCFFSVSTFALKNCEKLDLIEIDNMENNVLSLEHDMNVSPNLIVTELSSRGVKSNTNFSQENQELNLKPIDQAEFLDGAFDVDKNIAILDGEVTEQANHRYSKSNSINVIYKGKKRSLDALQSSFYTIIKEFDFSEFYFAENFKAIRVDNIDILPYQDFNKIKAKELCEKQDAYLISINVKAVSGASYPLPGYQGEISEIKAFYCNVNDIIFEKDALYDSYKFKITDNSSRKIIKIRYIAKSKPASNVLEPEKVLQIEKELVLIQPYPWMVKEFLKKHTAYDFLFDERMGQVKKIEKLIDIFKHMSSRAFEQEYSEFQSYDIFKAVIRENTGACRHRANAFVLIMRAFDIPTLLVHAPGHMYAKALIKDENGNATWQICQLGGTPTKIIKVEETKTIDPHEEAHTKAIKEYFKAKVITDLVDLIKIPNVLLKLPSWQSPWLINHAILSMLRENELYKNYQHIYIDSPQQLKLLYQDEKLIKGQMVSVPGPLQRALFSQEKVVLVINWDKFTPVEMASYKCWLEKDGHYHNKPLNPNRMIIGINQKSDACDAFTSRCQTVLLEYDLSQHKLPKPVTQSQPVILSINLHHESIIWPYFLLGKTKIAGKQCIETETAFIQALKTGNTFTIINPPNAPEFNNFITQILSERKLWLRGELYHIPESFTIQFMEQALLPTPDNIKFITDEQTQHNDARHFYLNISNFLNYILADLQIDQKNNSGDETNTILKQYNLGDIIHINSNISQEFWQFFCEHITKYYPNQTFQFYLMPGFTLEESTQKMINKAEKISVPTLTTADNPKQAALSKLTENPQNKLIFINQTINSNDLLSTISAVPQEGHTDFILTTQGMLNGLIKTQDNQHAENIILVGDISPELENALQPLLENNSQIFYNGQWHERHGQLQLIRENKQLTKTTLTQATKTIPQSYAKTITQIDLALQDKQNSIIFLEGDTGIGKTTTALERLQQANLVYATDILLWLTNPEKYPILFLDEANLAPTGTWEFLTALSLKQPIYYAGQWYPHNANRKVFATGNLKHFAHRQEHPVFTEHATWIHFVAPDDAALKEKIIIPVLHQFSLADVQQDELANKLIQIYHLLRNNRDFYTFSLRDFKNLTIRFCHLWKNNARQQSLSEVLLAAFNQEYFYYFRGDAKQQAMAKAIANLLELTYESQQKAQETTFEVGGLTFPSTRRLLIEILFHDIELAHYNTKRGILLEGPSGIGKSSIFYAILDDLGYNYVRLECTPGDDKYLIKLFKACLKGKKVVLNEIDLDPRAEQLLNHLLTNQLVLSDWIKDLGRKMQMTPQQLQEAFAHRQPGFFVFASKNHSVTSERIDFSTALADRLHCLYVPAYTRDELITLAKESKVEYPKNHVDIYLEFKRADPRINLRKFFDSLNFFRIQPKSIKPVLKFGAEFLRPENKQSTLSLSPTRQDNKPTP